MKDRSSLVLMEQLIMILIFALAAALCLRTFAHADRISRGTGRRDLAATLAQNAAEQLKYNNGSMENFPLAPGTGSEDNPRVLFYDENGSLCSGDRAAYRLELLAQETGSAFLGSAEIRLFETTEEEKPLYSLTVHWQEGL